MITLRRTFIRVASVGLASLRGTSALTALDDTPAAAPERIDADSLADLRAAQEMLRQAQAVYAFTIGRVALRYGLLGNDQIADDGTIERA